MFSSSSFTIAAKIISFLCELEDNQIVVEGGSIVCHNLVAYK